MMDEHPTEDEIVFGVKAWVYCRQHMKPHMTGWCGVGNRDKVGLGLFGQPSAKRAYEKCKEFGLEIYNPNEHKVQSDEPEPIGHA